MLHAVHSVFNWRILQKTRFYSGSTKQENLSPFTKVCCRTDEQGQKSEKLKAVKTRVYTQEAQLKMQFKNSISGFHNLLLPYLDDGGKGNLHQLIGEGEGGGAHQGAQHVQCRAL
jgi:hypothetical protein